MIIASAVFTIKTAIQSRQSAAYALLKANIEALVSNEDDAGAWTIGKCHSAGGNWDMASVCEETGFESATCKVSGEINIFGIKLSGSYEKGQTYYIPWARYKCVSSSKNCCTKQGLYTGNTKLA